MYCYSKIQIQISKHICPQEFPITDRRSITDLDYYIYLERIRKLILFNI